MGGKVYVNWRMHAAPMRVTSEVMLGMALPRTQATAQYTMTDADQYQRPLLDVNSGAWKYSRSTFW